jgi:hypothetical protein
MAFNFQAKLMPRLQIYFVNVSTNQSRGASGTVKKVQVEWN